MSYSPVEDDIPGALVRDRRGQVSDGWLTLTGTVNHQFESDPADDDVAGLQGVPGITNQIRVVTP